MDFNANQKEAIEHGDGPLLIIAGAGTGKTRVITSRIIRLINSGKVKPPEILALTFTDKAANEMIDRIDVEMPLSYEELCIKTFHSFAEQVLRESGMEIGIDPSYKILDNISQWFFFKKNFYHFDLNYYRPLGNPNKFIKELYVFFGKLKDELISPEKFLEYAKNLPDDEVKTKTLEIAHAYVKYQEILIKNNCVDFADLCYFANKLFDTRKSVLKKYSDRFKYILVDEFQDTNHTQFQMVLKLAGMSNNLTVVGDDDQSIYKWRGASLSNILQFEEYFPNCKKVVLNDNYRSIKKILNASYNLIQNNNPDRLEAKLGLNKKLASHSDDEGCLEVHHFPNFVQECSFVADKIKELHQKNGIDFDKIAILIRSNGLAYPFIDEFKAHGLPYQVRNPKGLLGLSEIKDLVALLKFLSNPKDDISLLRVMKMDIFEIPMADILSCLRAEKKQYLFDSLNFDKETSLPGLEDPRKQLYELLVNLIEFSKNHTVGEILNEFIKLSGYLKHLVDNDYLEEIANINEFAKKVAKFEKENEDRSVIDFVSYLDLMEEAGAAFSGDDSIDRNSVQILTVHGSKGLEFDCVFVVNLVSGRFPSQKHGEFFPIPETLTSEVYPTGDFSLQEERRLFYVAMTRARKYLYLTYSDQYEGNKNWKPSIFVNEILKDVSVVNHEADVDATTLLRKFKEPVRSSFILPKFNSKKISYSQFDTFKNCPLKYNYRYLLKVPTGSSHVTSFGSSIHETLNQFYRLLKSNAGVGLDVLENIYHKNWLSLGYENQQQESEKKQKGWLMLMNYFVKNSNPWVIPAYLEKNFNLRIDEFLINGRIDRIDKLPDGTYEVIDYKTGRVKEAELKNFQLPIYYLACKESLNLNVSMLSIYFLEDNEKISISSSKIKTEDVKSEILRLINEIKNSDFPASPGYNCSFCDYRIICPAV